MRANLAAALITIRPVARCWRCTRMALLDGLLLALLLLGLRVAVAADVPPSREYQIKAAFLYNIPKFVEWPADSFADINAPLVIGVLGVNPFGDQLEVIVRNRKINGRSLIVKQVETVEEAKATHLLFVSSEASQRFWLMRKELADSAVLTVGESAAFIAAGGGIRFIPVGDKLSFEINMQAAEQAHLKISSQLQKLATSITRTQ